MKLLRDLGTEDRYLKIFIPFLSCRYEVRGRTKTPLCYVKERSSLVLSSKNSEVYRKTPGHLFLQSSLRILRKDE